MKIALCLFGQPRNAENLKVFESHKEWILDKYDTDVYCHTWFKPGCLFEPSTWNNVPRTTPAENILDVLLTHYKPLRFEDEEPKEFEFDPHIVNSPRFTKFPYFNIFRNRSNVLSQFYSIQRVAKMVEDSTVKYDFIIMARYDAIVLEFPDLRTLDPSFFYCMDHHPRFPDPFFIFGPKFLPSQRVYDNSTLACKNMMETKDPNQFWEFGVECVKYNVYLLFFPASLIRGVRIRERRNM